MGAAPRSDLEGLGMSKLSTKARKDLPAEDFAGPDRSFPIPDKDHAEAAIIDAPEAERHGSITASEKETIDKRAEAKLDKHPTRIAIRKASHTVQSRG
jgi:hypothetical protein